MEFKTLYNSIDRELYDYTLVENAILMTLFIEQAPIEVLSEGIEQDLTEGVSKFLKGIGLHAHKGKGLIDYITQFTKGIGGLMYAAIRKDTEGMKKILKSVKKQDVLHFLLQLDQASLHIVTGPIHFIDAVTGWHIGADLGALVTKATETAQSLVKSITTAFNKIKDSVINTDLVHDKTERQLLKHITKTQTHITTALTV